MVSQKKCLNFIWAIILSLIFMYGGSLIGGILTIPLYIVLLKLPLFYHNQDLLLLLVNLLTFAAISLLVFFRVKVIEKRSLSSIGFNKNNWLKKYSLGFLIGLAMMSIIVLILLPFGYTNCQKILFSLLESPLYLVF